jgi:IS1 family transposase
MHVCKLCGSEALIKRGLVRGKQRYFCKLCERHHVIGDEREVEMACTDGNPLYAEVFEEDANIKHIVTKAETCLVESFNQILGIVQLI